MISFSIGVTDDNLVYPNLSYFVCYYWGHFFKKATRLLVNGQIRNFLQINSRVGDRLASSQFN
jgi:hypothetical protein